VEVDDGSVVGISLSSFSQKVRQGNFRIIDVLSDTIRPEFEPRFLKRLDRLLDFFLFDWHK
jgi:hypothetical protein